ncbi:MAG TPA: hypothetical protein VL354_01600, partial [Spirochaetia bacterium]|nr:hypothetical protein [Spirochaetia bacterium]
MFVRRNNGRLGTQGAASNEQIREWKYLTPAIQSPSKVCGFIPQGVIDVYRIESVEKITDAFLNSLVYDSTKYF